MYHIRRKFVILRLVDHAPQPTDVEADDEDDHGHHLHMVYERANELESS